MAEPAAEPGASLLVTIKKRWRAWLRAVHRDLGYVAVAMTLAYGLSGIAVNHLEDWNPNYVFDTRAVDVGPLPAGDLAAMQAHVTSALRLDPRAVRGHFQDGPRDFRVFLGDGQEVRVDVASGRGVFKGLARRLRERRYDLALDLQGLVKSALSLIHI